MNLGPSILPLLIQLMLLIHAQPVFTCSKLTIETIELGVKYVQS